MSSPISKNGSIEVLDDKESAELFERAAKYYLDMSSEDFLEMYKAGKFDEEEVEGAEEVIALMPFSKMAS